MKRPATSPVIKMQKSRLEKKLSGTNIRQEQQVKSVTRTNQPNVAESSSNHKEIYGTENTGQWEICP